MPKSLSKSDGYAVLLGKVRGTLIEGQRRIDQERVRTYWETGRVICEDILRHKDRAEYGAEIVKRLADDLEIDLSVLQRCIQFVKAYPHLPIVGTYRQFTWSHYLKFITIPDDKMRSRVEKMALQNDWSVQELAARIKKDRPVLPKGDDQPVVQLTFTRGRLHTYRIVPANKSLLHRGPLALDLGFREQYTIPAGAPRVKENDTVELIFSAKGGSASGGKEQTLSGARKVSVAEGDLFTYVAHIEKVIDADTLLVSFDFGCPMSVSQKLRLRGIDCPEIDTEEGKRAKRFVEARLRGCDFIVVKTHKDRTDRFDRYLADIFCTPGGNDAAKAAAEGAFLNQELLDARLARAYP